MFSRTLPGINIGSYEAIWLLATGAYFTDPAWVCASFGHSTHSPGSLRFAPAGWKTPKRKYVGTRCSEWPKVEENYSSGSTLFALAHVRG